VRRRRRGFDCKGFGVLAELETEVNLVWRRLFSERFVDSLPSPVDDSDLARTSRVPLSCEAKTEAAP
jgi:hypothetical protein